MVRKLYANYKVWYDNSKATFKVNVTGENVDLRNVGIFINGKEISHDRGNAKEYKVTENGTYKITVTYPGMKNIEMSRTIDSIVKMNMYVSGILNADYCTSERLNIRAIVQGSKANPNNIGIFVDGKEISHQKGVTTHTFTTNGNHKIVATYPGLNDKVEYINIQKIDRVKPSYTFKTTQKEGTNEKYLSIKAQDDKALKSVTVDGKSLFIFNGGNLKYLTKILDYTIKKSGNYKIRVEDVAGNYYEKTENIQIDTTPPKVKNFIVKRKNEMLGNSSNINDSKNTKETKYCAATIGNKMTLTAELDDDAKKFDGLYFNGREVSKADYKYKNENKKIIINMDLTHDIIKAYRLDKFVTITINGISDKWGNKQNFKDDKSLYVDYKAPIISNVTIKGGTLGINKDIIELYKGEQIKVEFLVNKKLYSTPYVSVIKPSTTGIEGATYDKIFSWKALYEETITKDNQTYYKYGVALKSFNIIRKIKNKIEGHIKLYIDNCYDESGNITDAIVIDEKSKSSNGVSLVYGKVQTGKLYLSGMQNVQDKEIGDINLDGYINDYDYLLLSRHLADLDVLNEDKLKLANVDGNDVVDKKDLSALGKIIVKREDRLPLNSEIKFEVYDKDNTKIVKDNLNIEFEEGKDLAEANVENGIVTIKTKETTGNIKINVAFAENGGYEQEVGQLTFKIGEIHTAAAEYEVVSENKNNRNILGDVNNDGYVTLADTYLIQAYLAGRMNLTDEQKKVADIFKDNTIDIDDATSIQSISKYNYNGMKKGDKIKLKFNYRKNSYNNLKDDSIENQISWDAKGNPDSVTIVPNNEDGTAEVTINNNAKENDKIIIECKVKINDNTEAIAQFNIMVIENIEVSLSEHEIDYDLSKLDENNKIINAITNISNRPITWSVSDNDIVNLRINMYGDVEITPIKSGKTKIKATVDGIEEECAVYVRETIRNISVGTDKINVEETEEEEFSITLDPVSPTEEAIVISEDENVAKVYKDEKTGKYKVLGVKEGNTKIVTTSPSNDEIKQEIAVRVIPLNKPIIQNILVGDEDKIYKTGDKVQIKIQFSETVKGDVPTLKIGFGSYQSVSVAEFKGIEENNTTLVYEYELKAGDNGVLELYTLEGGNLTDTTGKLDAELIIAPEDNIDDMEDIVEESEILELADEQNTNQVEASSINNVVNRSILRANGSDTTEDNAEETNKENEQNNAGDADEFELVSSGLFRTVSEIQADTEKPEVTIEENIDKDSCWLREGDIAKVKVISNEELQEKPIVTMGGQNAIVEGEGTEFIASIPVSKELQDGYLEIKVKGYKDLAGNDGEELTTKEDNIEEPIVIDNSGTKIKSVTLIKQKGKEYKEGDQFDINVKFEDKNINRQEFIKAAEVPQLKLKFGGKEAQGEIESDFVSDEYTDNITYSYKLSAQDQGKLQITQLLGAVVDVAGNETQLSDEEIENTEVEEVEYENGNENNESGNSQNEQYDNEDTENNSNDDGLADNEEFENNEDTNMDEVSQDIGSNNNIQNDDKLFGILPNTGDTILGLIGITIGLLSIMSGILYIFIKRRR